jgi:hypothetical protein
MRKCNDEVYQLAKDQALIKKVKKQTVKRNIRRFNYNYSLFVDL